MEMMDRWKSYTGRARALEMFEEVSSATLDVLLRCLFSESAGCQSGHNKRYLKTVKFLTRSIVDRVCNPFLHFDFIYFHSPSGKQFQKELKIAHEFTETLIRERVNKIKSNPEYKSPSDYDFLDVLLMANGENGTGLTHKEIRDELDTFVFEGHDTVTSGISWAFYNLALYPVQQEMCRDEVISVLAGAERVDWSHLKKLAHLTKFIKESMRLFPPVIAVARKTGTSTKGFRGFCSHNFCQRNKTDEIGKVFPKDTMLRLGIFALHRNPELWNNPETFDPKRFEPAKMIGRSPHAYVPFSAGPRNCIGQNFAMNEMKVMLSIALKKFKFTVDSSYPAPRPDPSIILGSTTGIHLLVEKI